MILSLLLKLKKNQMTELIQKKGRQYSALGFYAMIDKLFLRNWQFAGWPTKGIGLFQKSHFDCWVDENTFHIAFFDYFGLEYENIS